MFDGLNELESIFFEGFLKFFAFITNDFKLEYQHDCLVLIARVNNINSVTYFFQELW